MSKTRKGWECPSCNKIHAPWVEGCDCENEKTTAKSEKNRDGFNHILTVGERIEGADGKADKN